ncbi:MAG TPA: ADP-ribosylglycohydrolase family protein [Bacilli bacterium]|jgi:ADP-ribosylglycohydrolase|nr:ADP-ribosylglycohydrolase family protein [Bacilli bacterium]HOD61566.1 ADP-ribosylglycohydrolase family protein [Bacilli bacterium]HOE06945.1 ADP-ribosylglycohydrolase family protein [Bacilli bacterium]HOH61827.1 ADP-ribosylglycohydrolase family protein [Bacilli bacterium]HOR17962.1 ADP-ribosylglycohydrolase family protein [Bacilli bacterium]
MKKAWEREFELMQQAKPVVLEEDEQGWLFSEQIEQIDDIMLKSKWKSNVPGSNAPERVIIGAIADMGNMGYDVTEAEKLIDEGLLYLEKNDIVSLNRVTWRIWNILNNAKPIKNHPSWQYRVYDSFDKVLEDINQNIIYPKIKMDENYLAQTYYGWLAQIVAGAIGTAVEGYTTKNIREAFGEIYDYVRKPNTYNDDITYEIAFLKALERKGKKITSADIAEEWTALIPYGWSAEEWALKNIKMGIYPPESGFLHNPYREWIGAQMRGAVCGMVAPNNPLKAAELAFMDGVVSHYNNGVIGEIFNAVLVSLAYGCNDVKEIVKTTIAHYIPKKSEYYTVVKYSLDVCEQEKDWEAAWTKIIDKYKQYNWIHAYPNAAAEVVSLWFGNNDFDETMHVCAMIGYDVDCNAAQIGTLFGIIGKEKALKEKWTKPIGDELKTYIRANKSISIKELAKFTVKLAKTIA